MNTFCGTPNRKQALQRASLLTSAALLTLTQPALSETPDEAERAVRVLDTVTVIGNIEDPQSTYGSAYTLTERELQKFESANVNSILRSVPGVYVREEDGLGAFPRIGIRASSSGRSDRILVLEDGVPAAMAPYANTSAYYFPNISRMRSVEVLKGPETLLYGPQNVTGVVNLLATAIPEEREGFLRAEIGDNNTRRLHAWYGDSAGPFSFLIETYQGSTDGFQKIDRTNRTAGNNIEDYVLRLQWAGERQRLEFKAQQNDESHDVSYLGLTDADFKANPDRRYGLSELERMNRGRTGFGLHHEFELTDSWALKSTAYWTDTRRHYRRLNQINGVAIGSITTAINTGAPNAALLQGILDGTLDTTHANGVRYGNNFQEFTSQGIQTQLEGEFTTGPLTHNLTFGIRRHEDETRNVAAAGNEIYQQVNGSLVFSSVTGPNINKGEAEAWSIWLGDRISYGSWSFLPVIRYEDIKTVGNVLNPTPRNSLTKTSVGLGVNYAVDANWTLLAGVYEGFAPPGSSAAEGTKGEESVNWEAGVRYRKGSLGIDAIAFLSDYDNALRLCLVANPCPGGIVDGSTLQSGAKEVYGLELGAFATLFEGNGFTVPARLSYTYTDGEYTRAADTAGGVLAGDTLDYTPPHTGVIQVGLEHKSGWDVYAALNYTDATCTTTTCDRAGVDATYLRTESLLTMDLSASYNITDTAEIYTKVENLFDERAIVHRGADGARGNPGRYFGVGVRLNF
ncbi:TonB-dependent receptor family protein [Hyphomonas sp.]|uniref:TonB-dependent receptor family protein n=1 Tax=Hyphomonas sp. TaxID=87 RepID=UPI00391A29EE